MILQKAYCTNPQGCDVFSAKKGGKLVKKLKQGQALPGFVTDTSSDEWILAYEFGQDRVGYKADFEKIEEVKSVDPVADMLGIKKYRSKFPIWSGSSLALLLLFRKKKR
jgi:hypothetical protein